MLGHRKLNVQDYLAILKRRWLLIAIPLVIFPIVGYATTYFITPQFISQTLVIIKQQEVPEDYVKPVVNEDLDARLASMREEILSRSSLKPIIDKYNLYSNEKMSMDDRIDLARTNIGIKTIPSISRSNDLPGFYISFKASDAHTAQAVCEEITGLFINQNQLARENAVEDTTKYLLSEQTDAKAVLDEQAKKLADFQRQYAGRLPDDAANNLNLLSTLNSQLQSGTEQLSNMEGTRAYIESMIASASAPAAAAGSATQTPQAQQTQLDALLAQEEDLKAHYQEAYPPLKNVERKIADLRSQMAKAAAAPPPAPSTTTTASPNRVESASLADMRARLRQVDQAIELKRREQDTINQQINKYKAAVEATPQVEEEFKGLTRDNLAAQAQYDSLSKKINDSKMATDLEKRQQGELFSIKDPANLPDGPVYPRRSVFISGGFGAGLAIGLLIIAFLEYKDTSLRSERDVWAFTQLPTLAVIAWSADVARPSAGGMARLKRLFSRKPKDTVANAAG